ncbi:MAG TPA: histone deacetylase [Candidatus Limnocylindria bacterium]|nr:histone deacetylase [Candidatus Limnocylindria bacterium]
MAKSAVVIDREYLKHLPGEGHPERPERIQALLDLAERLDTRKFQLLPPRAATRAEVELIHVPEHVGLVESTSKLNHYALDGDTITSRDSFAVSLFAVGGFLCMLDAIAAGDYQNGFALVRPPGHHALRDRAMGFCLFNTMAIGAEYLKRAHGAKRVMIMDWDVHHGNGTQDAFYDDPSVLFLSTHQFPFYPGSGGVNEIGVGAGEGYTINVPLPAGCADVEYQQVFQEVVVPAAEKFMPEWILVSAGFDPHRRDPLASMNVTEEGFAAMAERLLELADRFSGSRTAFLLEGGYDLAALKNSAAAVLTTLQERRGPIAAPFSGSESGIEPLLRRIRQVHEKYQ